MARVNFGGFASRLKNEFYIYGGRTNLGPDNELWVFRFSYMKWEKLQTFETPTSRSMFGFTNYVEDSYEFFVMQGGITTDDQVNSMYRYF